MSKPTSPILPPRVSNSQIYDIKSFKVDGVYYLIDHEYKVEYRVTPVKERLIDVQSWLDDIVDDVDAKILDTNKVVTSIVSRAINGNIEKSLSGGAFMASSFNHASVPFDVDERPFVPPPGITIKVLKAPVKVFGAIFSFFAWPFKKIARAFDKDTFLTKVLKSLWHESRRPRSAESLGNAIVRGDDLNVNFDEYRVMLESDSPTIKDYIVNHPEYPRSVPSKTLRFFAAFIRPFRWTAKFAAPLSVFVVGFVATLGVLSSVAAGAVVATTAAWFFLVWAVALGTSIGSGLWSAIKSLFTKLPPGSRAPKPTFVGEDMPPKVEVIQLPCDMVEIKG